MATAMQSQNEVGHSYRVSEDTCVLLIEAGITPYLKGPPGCGKTAMAKSIAKRCKLEGLRLTKPSFHETVDYTGVPFISAEDGGTYFAPNYSIFPGPKDPETGLFVIDEAADASVPVKNVLCAIVEERRAAGYAIPAGWATMMTGNRVADRSGATKEITKLISRVCVVPLDYTVRDWNAWAPNNGIYDHVSSYTNFASQHLMTFDPVMQDAPYACPRTWEKVSNVLKKNDNLDSAHVMAAIDGLISPGVARGFRTFVKLLFDMPDPLRCIANPVSERMPDRPEVRWALCSSFIKHATKTNVKHIRTYVERMPEGELQMFVLRSLFDTMATKIIGEDFSKWVTDRKDLL
jgi:hypothetical protein